MTTSKLSLVLLAAWAPLALAPALSAQGNQTAPTLEPRLELEEVEDLVQMHGIAAMESKKAAGYGVAVGIDGVLIYETGLGLADLEQEVPVSTDSVFRIGSITKQFTAAYTMRLIEAGKLSLDTPIDEHLGFPLQDHKVTLLHLLNHTSGIPSYTSQGAEWMQGLPLEMEHEQLMGLVSGKPFDFEPGSDFRYNNSGYYLLGMLLEQVAGKPYTRLIPEQLCGPLGLGIRYESNTELIPHRVQGYASGKHGLENDMQFGVSQPGAAGALLSTAGDLVRWSHMLQSGKVVSVESYQAMSTPTKLDSGKQQPYGFGLSLDSLNGHQRIGHGGSIFGFNSMLSTYPAAGLVVCVLSNSEGASAPKLARSIAASLLAALSRE